MTQKYLMLDAGNVLFDLNLEPFFAEVRSLGYKDPYGFSEKWMPYLDLGLKTYSDVFKSDEFQTKISRKLADDHYEKFLFSSIEAWLPLPLSKVQEKTDKILKLWRDAVIPNDAILNIVKAVLDSGVNVAILSNIGSEHREILDAAFQKHDLYKRSSAKAGNFILHCSVNVGARKPDKLYFQSFLLDHPEARHQLFLDDRDINILSSRPYFESVRFAIDDDISEAPQRFNKILKDYNYL